MIQKPRGTEDIFEQKAKEFFSLEMIIRNLVDLYNYNEIKTPIFEVTELFKRGVGTETDIVSKEMFSFLDRKNRELTLRPEGTAPTVRAVLENKLYINEKLPLKLFYFGNMFRYERPQAGRQRQFNQFGIEVFGPKTFEIDSEIICLAVSILKTIGLEQHHVHLNYLVSGAARKQYIIDLKAQLKSLTLCADCVSRLETNPLRVLDCKVDNHLFGNIVAMSDYLNEADQQHYQSLKTLLSNIGIKFVEDKLLVRGLDYYTGFVFEIKDSNNSTLLGGGRYDNLVKELGDVDLPAAGFAFGLERIILALESLNISLVEENYLDAYIIGLTPKAKHFANILLLMLRSSDLKVDFDFMDRSLKSAFKQSEKFNAKNIIIIGDNELKENVVVIKIKLLTKSKKLKLKIL
ncbi:histidyl-tRNA synthetase [Spiroplasma clarkii]|uniref:histidine--tRNA ligase n=1 Tax=Spiroplasma clarkii TaxID=2139 RepID=UPI000B585FD0|nr:histidine--tRNA ligase [Spiroplasma clarkii]ARU91641.1 histidyl-tRNA synthetase [Spiroplasma clarkii]